VDICLPSRTFNLDEEVSEVVADEEKTWIAVKFKFTIETITARIFKDIKSLVSGLKII
jgi:hypothetical protein